jgi:hypothetical protein
MPTQKEIDDLIKMLDGRMSEGTNRINVQVNRDENAHIEMDQVTVETGMDCEHGDTACKIPNLKIDGLDDEY